MNHHVLFIYIFSMGVPHKLRSIPVMTQGSFGAGEITIPMMTKGSFGAGEITIPVMTQGSFGAGEINRI